MKKKLVSLMLIIAIVFSFGCSSSKKTSENINEPDETHSQYVTDFGLSYEVPESWKAPDTNTNESAYYYINKSLGKKKKKKKAAYLAILSLWSLGLGCN